MGAVNDSKGVAITVGCRVRQLNVIDPDLGALSFNAQREGVVMSLGRTRAEVQFPGRTAVYGFRFTDEPKTDRVHAKYLEVLPTEGEA